MSDTSPGAAYQRLFSPLQVGPMRVPNRICETANTIGAGRKQGLADDEFIAHHLAKARGGTGWIGNETWLLNSPLPAAAQEEYSTGGAAIRYALYELPGFVEGVARFCAAVHQAGAVAVFQLTHINLTTGASSVPIVEIYDAIPHALDDAEIEFVVDTYARAAERFREGGGDGIEIHCAHESLPHTFLSPAMNKRTDRWGGDARGRIRFVVEVLERVRARIGDAMALGIRVNGEETREGGYDLLELREMVYYITETGLLDFVNVDVGHCWGLPSYVQPSFYDHAEHREAGKALRADLERIPVLFSGRVNDPLIAEQLLADGVCDLVGMTRAGIADPEFANKAREGRLTEMRRCIGCNRCIAEAVHSKVPEALRRPVCSVNPVAGQELLWHERYAPASPSQHVVVAGGGPAGLEAARVAAMRGHRVTLFERGKALGGQVRLAAKAPGRDAFEDFIYYEENQMRSLGVDLRLGVQADAEILLGAEPEVIVCATGSRPRRAHVEGEALAHVLQGWDVLAGRAVAGERVAVISQEDYFETPNVADFIASRGKRVEIFHKWTHIGAEIDRYSIGPVMRRLAENGVVFHTGLRLMRIDAGGVDLRCAFTGLPRRFEGFDAVVLVYGSVPDVTLYEALKHAPAPVPVHLAGSAWVPRRLAEATQHGARVGLEI